MERLGCVSSVVRAIVRKGRGLSNAKQPLASSRQVAIPPARDWLDLLDYVDPDARGVEETEPPLPERFVAQVQRDGCAALAKAGMRGSRVGDLKLEAHARSAESLGARRGGGMRGVHERHDRTLLVDRPEQDEPARLEHDLQREPATVELP